MNLKKIYPLKFILIVLFSLIIKISYLDKFYTDIDDMISVNQILKYQNQSIYKISNDIESPTYNNKLKILIRKIEDKNNIFYDTVEVFLSKIMINTSPAKNSTYAPLQYLLFADLISKEHNYNQLKFYSRIPSVVFSILVILVTFCLSKQIFKNEDRYSLMTIFLTSISFPMIFISMKSYNYAAGSFSAMMIFYITYLEMINKNFSTLAVSSNRINIKSSIYLGLLFSILLHLSYNVFYLLPIFFIICFIKNFKLNNLFSKYNLNLLLIAIFFIFISLPLIIFFFINDLHRFGSNNSSLENFVFDLNLRNNFFYVIKFFTINSYLTVSKNLSFFTDNFYLSEILQLMIFIFVFFGLIVSMLGNYNHKIFFKLVIISILYYFLLVYFGILTLGPSRHTIFYIPLFAILFSISSRFFLNQISILKQKIIINILLILTVSIFIFSIQIIYKNYEDVFNEKYLSNLINDNKVDFILTNPNDASKICIMKSIKVMINFCPERNSRYSTFKSLNINFLKKTKLNKGSIMFINDDFNLDKYKNTLNNNDFNLIKKVEIVNLNDDSIPLLISGNTKNKMSIYVYK